MKKWDAIEQEYIFDHGWKLDKDEMLILTKDQYREYQYSGYLTIDKRKTLMLPSVHGCCLIFEGKHFRIV